MKLGVFSGTFDPVHKGHVSFAGAAMKQLGLDKVIFMPESTPRRKKSVSSVKDRARMLELALGEYDWAELFVSGSEAHSVQETVTELLEKYGEDSKFVLLMGVDVYEHLPEWEGHEGLLEDCEIALGLRTEDDGELAMEVSSELGHQPTMIVSDYPGLSSSMIRQGESAGVSEEVANYISDNYLYV